jgi:hypothetical protein
MGCDVIAAMTQTNRVTKLRFCMDSRDKKILTVHRVSLAIFPRSIQKIHSLP